MLLLCAIFIQYLPGEYRRRQKTVNGLSFDLRWGSYVLIVLGGGGGGSFFQAAHKRIPMARGRHILIVLGGRGGGSFFQAVRKSIHKVGGASAPRRFWRHSKAFQSAHQRTAVQWLRNAALGTCKLHTERPFRQPHPGYGH